MGKAKIKPTGKSKLRQARTKAPSRQRTPRPSRVKPKFFELPDGRKILFSSTPIQELFGILGPPPSGRSLRIDEIDDIVAKAVAERRMGKK